MSSISQAHQNENESFTFVAKFLSEFHVGNLLRKCNAGKEKGVPIRKRRGRSKYLLSVTVTLNGEEPIPVKIVYVRNKSNEKDWLAIISTDTELSEEEIICIYGKRWDIEVFFKSCKSYLRLVKETRSTSNDALNAHTAIVFTRYMILAVAQRRNEDERTICELFYVLLDEMEDISFSASMQIIVDALMEAAMEYFHITESQLEEFKGVFISHLPKCMQEALSYSLAVV